MHPVLHKLPACNSRTQEGQFKVLLGNRLNLGPPSLPEILFLPALPPKLKALHKSERPIESARQLGLRQECIQRTAQERLARDQSLSVKCSDHQWKNLRISLRVS